ncbi:MAG: DUF192 domain-containing protein [Limnothrix sp. BL-A-16]
MTLRSPDQPGLFGAVAHKLARSLLVLGAIGLMACAPLEASQPEPGGQQLPIEARTTIGTQEILLEVARTPEQQAIGLMFRRSLAPGRGMLFPFEQARLARFWMKNTLIPLDMVFLREGRVVAIEANVPPCREDPCPSYGPNLWVDAVLELPAGRSAQLGLKVGDRLAINPASPAKP